MINVILLSVNLIAKTGQLMQINSIKYQVFCIYCIYLLIYLYSLLSVAGTCVYNQDEILVLVLVATRYK